MYLVCEGVVGTGKSTQSRNIVHRLQTSYPAQEVVLVREPGWTEIAEAIRKLVQATPFEEPMTPLTDVYLYAAARAQLLGTVVEPALARGARVVSDRNVCSSLAIQWCAQGAGIDTVWQINAPAVMHVPPTAILFFDLPIELGLSRVFDLWWDKRELKGKEFYTMVYEGYLQIPMHSALGYARTPVDASWTPEDVFAKLQKIITPMIHA